MMRVLTVQLCVVTILVLSVAARAQFTTIVNIPPDPPVSHIGSNTQLNLFAGGALPDNFEAGVSNVTNTNLEMNLFGGTVGSNLTTHKGTTLNLSGGLVGQSFTSEGSNINLSGGRIVNNFRAVDSTINMSAGQIDALFSLEGTSILKMTGGSIGSDFLARTNTSVMVSGGTIGTFACQPNTSVSISGGSLGRMTVDGNATISGGTIGPFFIGSGVSQIALLGGEFRLNGNLISGLQMVGNTVPFNLAAGDTLSGTFADGTPFAFSSWSSDIFANGAVRLTAAALPAIGPPTIVASAGQVPFGIREGQTLVVDNGGVVPANFNAGRYSTVNVQAGGAVGANLEAVTAVVNVSGGTTSTMNMFVGATLNVTGGSVGTVLADRASAVNISGGSVSTVGLFNGGTLTMTGGSLLGLNAQSGGIVKISGGSVGNFARATAGSNVTISGGQIGTSFACVLGSTVAISGGLIGNGFGAGAGSTVTISGGAFGDAFQNLTGNLMRLLGGEFRINGTLVTGLDVVGSTKLVTVPTSGLLSGVFADGTPFAFASSDGDAINSVMIMAAQLPPIGSSLIDLPGSAAPAGIRNGQALNVDSGGQLPDNFNAGLGSTLHVYAGAAVGKNLEVLGANVDVLGGSIGDGFDAFSGSTITVRGGSIGESFTAHSGSTVDLQGGAISAFFQALAGSTVNLFGTDFFLNGTAITPLTMGQPFLLTSRTGTLSGHLADGSAFIFPFQTATRVGTQVLVSPDATLMLTLVPEPSGACVGTCGIGLFAMCLRRRSH